MLLGRPPLKSAPALGAAVLLALIGLWTFALQQAWAATPPSNTVAPSISGTPDVGRTLTANKGTWTGDPTITYAYQWQSCSEAWTGYSNPSGASASWYDVAYGGASGSEKFVAVGVGAVSAGRIITSPDGVTWTAQQDPGTDSLKEWRAVAYGAGRFVAVADYGDSGASRVMTSTDGVNWSYATSVPTNAAWKGLAFGGGKFVAVASTGTVMTSTDGLTWSLASSSPLAGGANSVNYGNGRFVVVGNDTAYYSANGDTFTQTTTPDNKNWNDVTYGGGKWVAVGTTSYSSATNIALVSTDNGSTWTQTTIPNYPWFGVTYSSGQFTAAGFGGSSGIATSPNGTDWTIQSTPNLASYSITAGAGTIVTVGDGGGGAKPIANLVTTCSDISGANSPTYQLQAGDQGKTIKVKVTATNGSGSADATSSATGAVGPEPSPTAPSNTSPPTISGTAEVGSTLSVDSAGTWDGYPEPTFGYQWQRCDEGVNTTTFPLGAGIEPMDIVLDGSGNAYVPDLGTGDPSSKVYKVAIPAGTVTQAGTTDKRPFAIARDSSGNLFTANEGANGGGGNVTKIDTGGTSTNFTVPGASPDPKAIAVDSSGNIYVAVYNLDTVVKLLPNGTAAGGNWPVSVGDGPRGIAIDSSGNLFVSNRFSNDVSKITPSGVATVSWAATGTGPFGIAVDSSDNVFVANVNSNSVTKITPAGTATTPFASTGPTPFGIAVDSSGNAYTANVWGPNVSKITPDGTSSILGTVGSLPQDVAVGSEGKIYSADAGGASVTELAPGLTCTDISGADDPTYQLTGDDIGKKIRVKVTGTNGSGSASAYSAPSDTVVAVPPANTDPPSISGDAKVGSTLTGDPGTWTGEPTPELTYQWQRCDADGTNCVDISGADGLTYEVTADDVGKKLKFKVTGSNDAGTDDAFSDPTAVIQPPTPPTPDRPSVEPVGRGGGATSMRLKVRCAGARACKVKITGKLKGGKGTVVPKTVRVGAGKQIVVKVSYGQTLTSELKRNGGGRIVLRAKQVGGATRTITVRVALPKPVTG